MKKNLCAVLVALAAAAPLRAEPLLLAQAQVRRALAANNVTRFTLSIAQNCGSAAMIVPTWCADKTEGVIGGELRELRAVSGRRIRFQLSNLPGTWDQPHTTERFFAVVRENDALLNGRCPPKALGCAVVPLGGTDFLWLSLEPGVYHYYDPSWPGSGYGVLRVVPDAPLD